MEYRFPEEPPVGTIITNGTHFRKRVARGTGEWEIWNPSVGWYSPASWNAIIKASLNGGFVWRDATQDELIDAKIIKDEVTVSYRDLSSLMGFMELNYDPDETYLSYVLRLREQMDKRP